MTRFHYWSSLENHKKDSELRVQTIPQKKRLKNVIGMPKKISIGIMKLLFYVSFLEILRRDVKWWFLDSDLDFVLHSDDHFESHLLGNGLYSAVQWAV